MNWREGRVGRKAPPAVLFHRETFSGYFTMRICPLEVLRSISGPPLPMAPSM